MLAGITQHPFEALRFAFSRLVTPNFTPINETLSIRPVHWIIFTVILITLVGLWRSLQHRPSGTETPSAKSGIDSGWAFIGILATGFFLGTLFQVCAGDALRLLVSRWLDEDGQLIVALALPAGVVGGSATFLLHLPEIAHWLRKRINE